MSLILFVSSLACCLALCLTSWALLLFGGVLLIMECGEFETSLGWKEVTIIVVQQWRIIRRWWMVQFYHACSCLASLALKLDWWHREKRDVDGWRKYLIFHRSCSNIKEEGGDGTAGSGTVSPLHCLHVCACLWLMVFWLMCSLVGGLFTIETDILIFEAW